MQDQAVKPLKKDMKINDRLCMAMRGQQEPYNILRVVDFMPDEPAVSIYFSLLKREFRLVVGACVNTHLRGEPIRVTFVGKSYRRPGSAILQFEAVSDDIEFKPLRPKESFYAADPSRAADQSVLRDGTDMQW